LEAEVSKLSDYLDNCLVEESGGLEVR